MKMKIKIDSRDMVYTIDTYGTFTADSTLESEIEYYKEKYDLTEDQIELDLDHVEFVKALAGESINILSNEFVGRFDYGEAQPGKAGGKIPREKIEHGIVLSIGLIDTGSPQFYNYTTDHYMAEWNIDISKLKAYCDLHNDEFLPWLAEQKEKSTWDGENEDDKEYQAWAMLDFYTSREYPEEEYLEAMYEREGELAIFVPSDEMQKLIDKKDKK